MRWGSGKSKSDIKSPKSLTLKVRIWWLWTQRKTCLISKTQHNSVGVVFSRRLCDVTADVCDFMWLGDPVMWLMFNAGTQEGVTGSSLQRAGCRRVAADAVGRGCSLLEGVFSVAAQQGTAGLHCQHMPLMLQILKRNIKRIYPRCWDLFNFYLMFLQIINSALNCVFFFFFSFFSFG